MTTYTVKFMVELDITGDNYIEIFQLITGGRAQLIIDKRNTTYGMTKHIDTIEIEEQLDKQLEF